MRSSARFRGWMKNPDARRTDGRIPYESTERAERHGRVRCQATRGIEITDEGTIQIAGLGELQVVGGIRRHGSEKVREVSIQETNAETPDGPRGPRREHEFVILITFDVEARASAPTPAVERPTARREAERGGGPTERAAPDTDGTLHERENRWSRRKNRRRKQGPAQHAHTDRDARPKGRARKRGRGPEWDAERY